MTKIRHIEKNGIHWTARQDLDENILDGLYGRLRRAEQDPDCTLVKRNPVRTVILFTPRRQDGKKIFIKFYQNSGYPEKVKHLLVPSKARSEWRNLNRFQELGLPCPAPIAFSESKFFGLLKESCLLLEAVPTAMPLNDYMKNTALSPDDRERIIQGLARWIRELHRNRVFYRDLHAGNILITGKKQGLYFIDLHRAALPVNLTGRMKIKDVAQLLNSVSFSEGEQSLFLENYLKETGGRKESFAARVAAKQNQLESTRIKSRSKRCLKNSSVFEKRKTSAERYHGRRDFGRQKTAAVLNLHQSIDNQNSGRVLKRSRKSMITVIEQEAEKPLCVKEDRFVSRSYALKNLCRRSRAMKSWIAANRLLVRGLDTPLPLAVVDQKLGFLSRRSFLIMEYVKDAREINDYIATFKDSPRSDRKTAFINALALIFKRLHGLGIYHADLKSNNILVQQTDRRNWKFYFVDLDRVRFKKALAAHQRANNLAQLNASVSAIMTVKDRLKFFHFYAKDTSLLQHRKAYFYKILAISRTKNTEPYGVRFQ